jgi:hypothetical protein
MPEAPSARLGLIGPSTTDPIGSFDEQMRAIVTQIEAVVRPSPQLVTSLPGSPYDGQEVYLQTAAMAAVGVAWHLRYRAAAVGSYKWEFLGGAPMATSRDTTFTTGSTTYTAVGSLDIAIPRSGEYEVRMEAHIELPSASSAFGFFAAAISSGSAVDTLAAHLAVASTGATQANVTRTQRSALAGGGTLGAYARQGGPAGSASFSLMRLALTPYRLA